MKRLWFVILLISIFSTGISVAGSCDPNDPNVILAKFIPNAMEYSQDPNIMLRNKWDYITQILQNEKFDDQTKSTLIDKIVSPIFDFDIMAKLSLGRTNWPKLNKAQQQKFSFLFVQRLKDSYREKVSLYTDETAVFKKPIKNKKFLNVPMNLISNNKNISVIFKLRQVEKLWKIYDVEIEGISILITYQAQFNDVIKRSGVEGLLNDMTKKPEGNSSDTKDRE